MSKPPEKEEPPNELEDTKEQLENLETMCPWIDSENLKLNYIVCCCFCCPKSMPAITAFRRALLTDIVVFFLDMVLYLCMAFKPFYRWTWDRFSWITVLIDVTVISWWIQMQSVCLKKRAKIKNIQTWNCLKWWRFSFIIYHVFWSIGSLCRFIYFLVSGIDKKNELYGTFLYFSKIL